MQHHYEGHWKGWALKIETFLGPEMARAKRVPFGPKKVEIGSFMYPSAVVYCCCVLLSVVVCCCVLLRVVVCCCVLEGWGGLLVAVLCEQVFMGWGLVGRAPPPPPTIVVYMDACWWVGGAIVT